jgi:hypothetical protein
MVSARAADAPLIHVYGSAPRRDLLDRFDAPVVEPEMGLVVHAFHALDRGLLHLVDDLAALASVGVDPMCPLVVHLQFEVLGAAAVTAKPAPYRGGAVHHDHAIRRVHAASMLAA